MQTVSRDIRTRRSAARPEFSPEIKDAFHRVFEARQDLARRLAAQILSEGEPEMHGDSTALCSHYRTRRGLIGGESAEAQVHAHAAGVVIRFWVYGTRFDVRVRDLILLALPKGEKGYEVWLDDGDKVFPHEGGKYDVAGRAVLASVLAGQ